MGFSQIIARFFACVYYSTNRTLGQFFREIAQTLMPETERLFHKNHSRFAQNAGSTENTGFLGSLQISTIR